MSDIWKKLDRWLVEHAPEAAAALNPPASEAAISTAEGQFSLRFPPALKALLLAHDGEAQDSAGVFAWWRLLPLSEIVDLHEEFLLIERQTEAGVLGDGAFDAKRAIPVMWCEGQIRYVEAGDGAWDGPLLELPRHGLPKPIARSLDAFFATRFEMLGDGRLVVEPDFGYNVMPAGASASGAESG